MAPIRSREDDAARGDAEKDEIGTTTVGFEDLVRDAGQRPRDVSLLQHGARSHPDLLPRLTGRT